MRACLAALLLLTTGSPALPQALTDCNNNGIPDDQDIGGGTSADANANGVPDECEPCGLTEDAKLVGLSGGERAGFAVALDNGVALMGSPNADVAATDAGSVRVLRRVGGQWRTEASLTAPDAAALDHFGTSVAIQSDLALVGAPDDDDTGSNSGSAYVFRFDGAAWALETKLRPGPSSAGARFGRCVALAGNRAFVGAPEANSLSGAVHVFEFDGAAWSQVARLAAPGTAAGDQFGRSVAATEDLLLVGAPLHDLPAGNAGAAYVYRLGSGGWTFEAKLTPSDAGSGDQFGRAVDLAGNLALIASPEDDDGGPNAGAAYLFRFEGSSWLQERKFVADAPLAGDRFGDALALAADTIAIAAPEDDDAVTQGGTVHVYRNVADAWRPAARLSASDGAADDMFGTAVAVSASDLLVGAWQDDDLGLSTGAVYLFGGMADCNENTAVDACDVVRGTSTDVNDNGVPDECDPDCNANGVPDDLDIGNGASGDCNSNGVPDECDIADGWSMDCNANAVPDECDLVSGTSADCNANGTPDECDLAGGASLDCNANAVPDECDLASGTSADCNANSLPDECEIGDGSGADCNSNNILDECDMAGGGSTDCNVNAIPDECDLAAGTSFDCNLNAIPDECDLAGGNSADCNGNGVPDECDTDGGRGDCDADEVPDSCEPDSDDDGVVDDCDDCPRTPFGVPVDPHGCPLDKPDSDGDGVSDDEDWCPETDNGRRVDEHGCAPGQLVTICHVFPNRPDRRETMHVPPQAAKVHLRHGDSLGPCEQEPREPGRRGGEKHGKKAGDKPEHPKDKGDQDRRSGEDSQESGMLDSPLNPCGAAGAAMLPLTAMGVVLLARHPKKLWQ